MASARVTVERGVVGSGLDYACAHIIIILAERKSAADCCRSKPIS